MTADPDPRMMWAEAREVRFQARMMILDGRSDTDVRPGSILYGSSIDSSTGAVRRLRMMCLGSGPSGSGCEHEGTILALDLDTVTAALNELLAGAGDDIDIDDDRREESCD